MIAAGPNGLRIRVRLAALFRLAGLPVKEWLGCLEMRRA
jgi:hypothetical protein